MNKVIFQRRNRLIRFLNKVNINLMAYNYNNNFIFDSTNKMCLRVSMISSKSRINWKTFFRFRNVTAKPHIFTADVINGWNVSQYCWNVSASKSIKILVKPIAKLVEQFSKWSDLLGGLFWQRKLHVYREQLKMKRLFGTPEIISSCLIPQRASIQWFFDR